MWSGGRLVSRVRDGQQEQGAKFADYFEFTEALTSLPSHRVLALLRGEKEEALELTFEPEEPDEETPDETPEPTPEPVVETFTNAPELNRCALVSTTSGGDHLLRFGFDSDLAALDDTNPEDFFFLHRFDGENFSADEVAKLRETGAVA